MTGSRTCSSKRTWCGIQLSPAHFWESMTADSGGIILTLEAVVHEEVAALREQEIEALEPYFSEADNAMELE